VEIRLTITRNLTFERDYVMKARHHQAFDKSHVPPSTDLLGNLISIIPICRYSAAIPSWDPQESVKSKVWMKKMWMCAFKKASRVNDSMADVTFWKRTLNRGTWEKG